MDTSNIDINTLDWTQERVDYVTNDGAASSSMEAAIQAMEDAMANAAQAEGGETAKASNNWRRNVERLDTLQERQQSYQDALSRVNYYASLPGITEEGVSSYYVGANLREIQRELFQPTPDLERMLELSGEVFDRLQSAEDLEQQNGVRIAGVYAVL